MSDYSEFFLNAAARVKEYDLLEIAHPDFTQTYYVVRNCANGLTVTLETSVSQYFQYYPLKVSKTGSDETLDQTLEIQLGDLGEVLSRELDAVKDADGFGTLPTVKYRTYRSDDLTSPLFGPLRFEISDLKYNADGAYFEAKAPTVNMNKTGEAYTFERFPTLKGFL